MRKDDRMWHEKTRKDDAPGTWLFGWFLLFVVIAGFMEAPVVTGIILAVILVGYVLYALGKQQERESEEREK